MSISEVERLFASFLDAQKIPYIRFSQEIEDFSEALRDMKAKRPDFMVFTENKAFFVEVKPNLIREKMPQLMINVDEVQKLSRLQLMSGVETFIVYPVDTHGTEWKPLRPAWISAHGLKRKVKNNDVFVVNVRILERLKLPFIT